LQEEFHRDFQKINNGLAAALPAHLNASDEELYLILQNPPSPPVPFFTAQTLKKNESSPTMMRIEQEVLNDIDSEHKKLPPHSAFASVVSSSHRKKKN